tara:strand:- start:66 stop:299 length:234 start_codon:yes stop_codon:yes gene_type:complete
MVRLTGEGWFDQPDVIADLKNHGYEYDKDYIIMHVPNIVNITYGRDVGYDIDQEHLGEEIESISATEIRSKRENLKE